MSVTSPAAARTAPSLPSLHPSLRSSALVGRWLGRLERARAWSHRGPVSAAAMKVGVSAIGTAVVLAGTAMLVLPGPGLVVMGLGVGVLATEWPWAGRVLHVAGVCLGRARLLLFPPGCSPARAMVGTAAVLATGAIGFAATTAITLALGSLALL